MLYAYSVQLSLLYSWLKAVFSQYRVVSKEQNTRDQLVWTARNEDPMHEVYIPHRIPRAWEQQR